MKHTTNLNLKKPDGIDDVDIEDINDNMDALDAEIGNTENLATDSKVIVSAINEIQEKLNNNKSQMADNMKNSENNIKNLLTDFKNNDFEKLEENINVKIDKNTTKIVDIDNKKVDKKIFNELKEKTKTKLSNNEKTLNYISQKFKTPQKSKINIKRNSIIINPLNSYNYCSQNKIETNKSVVVNTGKHDLNVLSKLQLIDSTFFKFISNFDLEQTIENEDEQSIKVTAKDRESNKEIYSKTSADMVVTKNSTVEDELKKKQDILDSTRVRKITLGTSEPSGGNDGDIYFQYE